MGGVDSEIFGAGNVQVTAYGPDNAQCKAFSLTGLGAHPESADVLCFDANGAPKDTYYTVLLAS